MAASGNTPQEVYANFSRAFKAILYDIASDSAKYGDFKESVESFFNEIDGTEETRWKKAREAIRAGAAIPDQYVSALPRVTTEARGQIVVERLDKKPRSFTPKDNRLDTFATAA